MPVDPYTGRYIHEPYSSRQASRGPISDATNIILDALAQRREIIEARAEREKAADVVGMYRESALGESDPTYRDPRLESRRLAELEAMDESRRKPFTFGGLFPSSKPAPSGLIGEDRPRIQSADEALSRLGTVLRPGTPQYREAVDEIEKIRSQAEYNRLAPAIAKRLGVEPEMISPGTINMLLSLERTLGVRRAYIRPSETDPNMDQIYGVTNDGSVVRVGDPIPAARRTGGSFVQYDPETGGFTVATGAAADLAEARAGGTARGAQAVRDEVRLRDTSAALKSAAEAMNDFSRQMGAGRSVPLGTIGNMATSLRSYAMDAGRLLTGVAGLRSVQAYIDEYDSPYLSDLARKNRMARSAELSLALLRWMIENPRGERQVPVAGIEQMLRANSGMFSDDPETREETTRYVLRSLERLHNERVRSSGLEGADRFEVRLPEHAPELFSPRGELTELDDETVSGGFESGQAIPFVDLKAVTERAKIVGPEQAWQEYWQKKRGR